jgi:hypothetical protein
MLLDTQQSPVKLRGAIVSSGSGNLSEINRFPEFMPEQETNSAYGSYKINIDKIGNLRRGSDLDLCLLGQ